MIILSVQFDTPAGTPNAASICRTRLTWSLCREIEVVEIDTCLKLSRTGQSHLACLVAFTDQMQPMIPMRIDLDLPECGADQLADAKAPCAYFANGGALAIREMYGR